MQSPDGEKRNTSSIPNRLWKNELIKTLILIGLVVVSVLVFRAVLIAALRTDYPLHTPISSSMEPTLNIGDLLIVQGVANAADIHADPANGDIIIFRKPTNPNEFIVHRAIEKTWDSAEKKYYFRTKGDNNRAPDQPFSFPPVPEDYVIGKVIWRIPFLGYIKIFLGTPVGIILTVILFVILIFLEKPK